MQEKDEVTERNKKSTSHATPPLPETEGEPGAVPSVQEVRNEVRYKL